MSTKVLIYFFLVERAVRIPHINLDETNKYSTSYGEVDSQGEELNSGSLISSA